MQKLLLIEPNLVTQGLIKEKFDAYEVEVTVNAASAIKLANENTPDLVVIEMSLAGHSGMEFIYEFRTYIDWREIPIIIYTSLRIDDSLRSSKAWEQLNIADVIYKPTSSLDVLYKTVDRVLATISSR